MRINRLTFFAIFSALFCGFAPNAFAQQNGNTELNKPYIGRDTIVTFDPKTYAQDTRIIESTYYTLVDEMPYVVGCDATPGHDNTCSSARMIAAISQKVQYPESMREQPTQGLVMLAIRISEKGEYDGVQATRFTNNDFAQAATSAARAAFKDMKFVPGKVAGKPVTVEVKLPVKFAVH